MVLTWDVMFECYNKHKHRLILGLNILTPNFNDI